MDISIVLVGLATAFNIIIVKLKFERGRLEDGGFDLALLFLLASVFSGSTGGLVIATITSAILSLYMLASPPKFFSGPNGLWAKFKKEFNNE